MASIALIIAILCTFFAGSTGWASENEPPETTPSPIQSEARFEPGQVIVGMKSRVTINELTFQGVGVREVRDLTQYKGKYYLRKQILLLTLSDETTSGVWDAIEKLKRYPDVDYAEPNYIGYLDTISTSNIPNDPYYNSLWGMEKIQAPEAWSITTGDSSVLVAVMDTGIDYMHEDLLDNVDPSLGGDFFYYSGDPTDLHIKRHGTHVSGTIGAVGNNQVGVVGVNWEVTLVPLAIFSRHDYSNVNSFIDAMTYVSYLKAEEDISIPIMNMSVGWDTDEMQSMVDAVDEYDGLLVVSAGNSYVMEVLSANEPHYMHCSNVIVVAASDPDDDLADFSTYGDHVHLAAPGTNILSTAYSYDSLNGTSMASPHVAGAAALLLSYKPDLTTAQLKEAILNNVDEIPALSGKVSTGGRLNVYKALQSVMDDGISLSETGTYDFPDATVDYGAQQAKSVTITNHSDQSTGTLTIALSGTNANDFTLNKNQTVVSANSTDSFTVVPNLGLQVGEYNAKIEVSGSNVESKSFDVRFSVNPLLPAIDITSTGLDNLKVGQSVLGSIDFTLSNGTFATMITPGDFNVTGLPAGLTPGNAVRKNGTVVYIQITGAPTSYNTSTKSVTLPTTIPAANVQGAAVNITPTGTVSASAVAKGDGAAVSGSPSASSTTANSITVNAVSIPTNPGNQSVQYAISKSSGLYGTALNSLAWQNGTTFIPLDPGTYYYVYARSAENTNYSAGQVQQSQGISTASQPQTYPVSLTIKKDGTSYNSHGKTFTLRQGGVTMYTGSGTGSNVTFGSVNGGTYDLYDGSASTGVTISSSNSSPTLDYYTVVFSVSDAGTASGSSISATYGGAAITSGAVILGGKTLVVSASGAGGTSYSYSWSGTASGSISSFSTTVNSAVNAICTVTGTGTISLGVIFWDPATDGPLSINGDFLSAQNGYMEYVIVSSQTIFASLEMGEDNGTAYEVFDSSGSLGIVFPFNPDPFTFVMVENVQYTIIIYPFWGDPPFSFTLSEV